MKRYLLIAGDNYYPQLGTNDWVGCFETYEEAEAKVVKIKKHEFSVNSSTRDWHEIVDLMKWMNQC
jgi:hypothetical protein